MIFVIDAQMPVKAAIWLRSVGHGAVHLNEIDMKAAGDSAIWSLCVDREATIITKDRDSRIATCRARGRPLASSGSGPEISAGTSRSSIWPETGSAS